MLILNRQAITQRKYFILFSLVICIAIFLRFFAFTTVPAGINQDEADAGYEAYSLIHHGTDKWGNKWPAYFISWGSGQNVLESYLDIPIIEAGGLNTFSVRVVPAVFGVLSVILLFFTLKRTFGRKIALISSFILAISPWAVLSSRIAIESGLLPFFILLGVFSIVYSYDSKYRKYFVPFSLIPFVLAIYAYLISVVVIPVLLVGIFIIYARKILDMKISFLISTFVFFLFSIPIDMFLVENFILHRVPHILTHLPFTTPILLESRLAQNGGFTFGQLVWKNFHFFTGGFIDGLPWSNLPGYSPVALTYFPLAIVGCALLLKSTNKTAKIFAIWFIASFATALIMPLNDIRANTFVIPLVVLAVYAAVSLLESIKNKQGVKFVLPILATTVVVYCGGFFYTYFTAYNNTYNYPYNYYNVGLSTSLEKAKAATKPGEAIYVSDSIQLNYVYTLFYLKTDSRDFQNHSTYYPSSSSGNRIYKVENFRNYYFYPDNPKLLASKSYVYVLKDGDNLSCKTMQNSYATSFWRVGRCYTT